MFIDEKTIGALVRDSRYTAQFLLGPQQSHLTLGWPDLVLGYDQRVSYHPRLRVQQVAQGEKSLTLIGYLLDWQHPLCDDRTLLERLLGQFNDPCELLTRTSSLGGRWILIAQTPGRRILFHDALGLRQVFYSLPGTLNGFWVCSQPGLLSTLFDLPIDPPARDFMDSYAFRRDAEYRWPLTRTPFAALRHLLPNHYLDMSSGEAVRYWPTATPAAITLDDAVSRLAGMLTGYVQAAATRYPLALGITAGLDSRVILAACRENPHQLDYLTVRQARQPDDHPDVTVPRALLAKLNLPHRTIRAAASMTPTFAHAFKSNVFLAHDHYGADAEAILAEYQRERVCVVGSGGEIGRRPFRGKLPHYPQATLTASDLAKLQRMDATLPFVQDSFRPWLASCPPQDIVDTLDLFDWEQGHGVWLAMTQLEMDIAWHDILAPFNSRDVLTTLLGVDEDARSQEVPAVFKSLIARLWPTLLEAPINPPYGAAAENQSVLRRGRRWLRQRLRGKRG